MSLYQTYRPHSFDDILGQGQVINILKAQAQTRNFHHAYLFTGPSGTGKTTTARVLAAALNCYNPNPDGGPCGSCQSCQALQKNGNHWDVFEIDAGRFRGIDDIRDLCMKAYYSPIGNKKVYIIDECHALTPDAWTALLKLLEEPPPTIVIILCTTQPDKILDTIKSRCQVYQFRQLGADTIYVKLETICRGIGINPSPGHLDFIATSAQGNMRTAENTLEQIAVLSDRIPCTALSQLV